MVDQLRNQAAVHTIRPFPITYARCRHAPSYGPCLGDEEMFDRTLVGRELVLAMCSLVAIAANRR